MVARPVESATGALRFQWASLSVLTAARWHHHGRRMSSYSVTHSPPRLDSMANPKKDNVRKDSTGSGFTRQVVSRTGGDRPGASWKLVELLARGFLPINHLSPRCLVRLPVFSISRRKSGHSCPVPQCNSAPRRAASTEAASLGGDHPEECRQRKWWRAGPRSLRWVSGTRLQHPDLQFRSTEYKKAFLSRPAWHSRAPPGEICMGPACSQSEIRGVTGGYQAVTPFTRWRRPEHENAARRDSHVMPQDDLALPCCAH